MNQCTATYQQPYPEQVPDGGSKRWIDVLCCQACQHLAVQELALMAEHSAALLAPVGKWRGPIRGIEGPAHQVTAAHGMLQMAVGSVQSVPACPAQAAPVHHSRGVCKSTSADQTIPSL